MLDSLDRPLAYHITFGTYGMRLHGDERGTVDRSMNQPGDPIIGADPDWERMERHRLRFAPVTLTLPQRRHAQSATLDICERGGWTLHRVAARPGHCHVLLSSNAAGTAVRKWFKRWLGEALSRRWPLPPEARWFAVGGSVRWVWTRDYFVTVDNYIDEQRAEE